MDLDDQRLGRYLRLSTATDTNRNERPVTITHIKDRFASQRRFTLHYPMNNAHRDWLNRRGVEWRVTEFARWNGQSHTVETRYLCIDNWCDLDAMTQLWIDLLWQ